MALGSCFAELSWSPWGFSAGLRELGKANRGERRSWWWLRAEDVVSTSM